MEISRREAYARNRNCPPSRVLPPTDPQWQDVGERCGPLRVQGPRGRATPSTTTCIVTGHRRAGEPALSSAYDPKRSVYEQFCKAPSDCEGEGKPEAAVRRADESTSDDGRQSHSDLLRDLLSALAGEHHGKRRVDRHTCPHPWR